jgi:hypothetical protein
LLSRHIGKNRQKSLTRFKNAYRVPKIKARRFKLLFRTEFMQMRFPKIAIALCSVVTLPLLSLTAADAAVMTYALSSADPTAGLGNGPFGKIVVTEDNGSLDIVETLNSGFRIHDGNSNHNALSFSLFGTPNPTISVTALDGGALAGFKLVSASSVSAPPFGTFDYALDCTVCGPGYGGGFVGPLSFKLSANTALTLASLQPNNGIFFASDLVSSADGNPTGNVGAIAAVPEPSTWAMLLLGFAGVGFLTYRKRQSVRFA